MVVKFNESFILLPNLLDDEVLHGLGDRVGSDHLEEDDLLEGVQRRVPVTGHWLFVGF